MHHILVVLDDININQIAIDHGLCHLQCISIVSKFIQKRIWIETREVLYGIKLLLSIFKLTINEGRVPAHICCQYDMRQVIPFPVCKWPDGYVWDSTPD